MISRSQMRRQLRANGGIMNARQGYGIGSWVKEKIRKLIPNELADIAVKAAPFVAPFNPAIAGLMSGVGSFDKTGRIGDSLKKGAMNYAGGQAARYLGGADFQGSPFSTDGGAFRGGLEGIKGGFSSPLGTDTGFKLGTEATQSTTGKGNSNAFSDGQTGAKETSKILSDAKNKGTGIKDIFQNKVSEFSSGLFEGVPLLGELPPLVQQQILVGGVTSAATYIYEAFIMEEPPQDENETMEEYLARRKENVGKKMRTYMDNYMAFDAEYSALDDAGKDAVVERYNKNMGGLMRRNYQTGGITMTNSLQQNIAQNKANQRARAKELEIARSRIPGYVAAEKVSAPTPAPMIEEIQETIQPVPSPDMSRPTINMPITNRPMPLPDMSRPTITMPITNRPMPLPDMSRPMPRPGPSIVGNPLDKFLQEEGNLPVPIDPRGPTPEMLEAIKDGTFEEKFMGPPDPQPIDQMPMLPPDTPPGSEDIMSGFEKFYKENYGDGPGMSTADVRTYKLPNGEIVQGSSTSMGQTNAYLKSIGQPPATDVNSLAGLLGIDSTIKPREPSLSAGINTGGKFTDLQRLPEPTMNPNFQNLPVQEQDAAMEKFTKSMDAYDKRFGSFADGRKIDPMQGKSAYRDILNAIQTDYPNIFKTLKGNETLAELDQKMLNEQQRSGAAKGGLMRLNYMIGGKAKQMEAGAPPIMYSGNMDPNAPNQQAGLPSVPGPMQMAEDGPEFDMRENGGFQPLGRQEGKDDVPAMLAKNEFVMTADAVRAAGGGSIQKGAQKMYDTMKKLESRVS